jgi:heme exporter protein B
MRDVLRVALAVAAKDIRIELRTRTAMVSSVVFALLVLAVLFVARDPTVISALDIAPAALWITFAFAGIINLNRAFALERENDAMSGIWIVDANPTGVFIGKLIANMAFVTAIEVIAFPLFVMFYDVPLGGNVLALIGVTVLATIGMVSVGTLMSSIVVQTGFAELMLPVLLLPFTVPPVVAAVQMTARILVDRPLSEMMGWFKLLAAFDLVFVAMPVLLFSATLDR